MSVFKLCKAAKAASYALAAADCALKNKMLSVMAESLIEKSALILEQNAADVKRALAKNSKLVDRLVLTEERIQAIARGVKAVAALPDPVNVVTAEWTTSSGLKIKKVRAPLGVIAVIYEARPNVTADVAALCLKSGNAVILRGGSDAICSNRAIYCAMRDSLKSAGLNADFMQFVDDTERSTTLKLLKCGKYVDVIIPRGGDSLKNFVLTNAVMPVIASSGGNCHIYVHKSANVDDAVKITLNAKLQRPGVCNACEQLIVDREIAPAVLPRLVAELKAGGCKVSGSAECAEIAPMDIAEDKDYYTEHLDKIITVAIVDGVENAVGRINEHNTKHSEAIIAEDAAAIEKFTKEVDAGAIYVNASTRFTDGFEFGFGAEIGISTQKLHARGPLGLEQLTSEKYIAVGHGTVRK